MPLPWRVAKSIETLRTELNELFPTRSRLSDGTVGDTRHANKNSDHNPWVRDGKTGVVTALDITHDPVHGLDSEELAEALIESRDNRIKYIISNRKIISGVQGPQPWIWRKYGGSNPHSKHIHISVEDNKNLYDDDRSWNLEIGKPSPHIPPSPPATMVLLKKGDKKKKDVMELQKLLNKHGFDLKVDGDFGTSTDRAVRRFQQTNGLYADGKVGPYTWEKLRS